MNAGIENFRCRRTGLFFLSLILVCAAPAWSATFEDLYRVTIPSNPAIGDAARRADAATRGMRVLLTRITGRQQAAAYPELRELTANAESYLTSYEFTADAVSVGFNGNLVDQALTRLNMPIWGQERPATLLWLAMDLGDGQRAELMAAPPGTTGTTGRVAGVASNPLTDEADEFFQDVTAEILTAADERGLPIVLPMLDELDRSRVRFADVWGGFDPLVARAAERYGVDAVLIARVSRSEFGPEFDWTVLRGDRRETLSTPAARLGVDWLADEYASTYSTIGGARLTWLTVRGIENWSDYRVLEYLSSLSAIEFVYPESQAGADMVFRITVRGDDSRLENLLRLDGQLIRVEGEEDLVYVPSWRAGEASIDSP